MPIKYIGRVTDFKGKSLWEILGNLKNFGIGRIVVRSMFERYPEPSYMKVVKVETLPAPSAPEEIRKIKVWVEKTFRGRTQPKLVEICSASYKKDYRLLAKHEEASYCKYDGPLLEQKILPRTVEFPPLLKELIIRDKIANGEQLTEELRLPLKYKNDRENLARVAKDNEKPTVEVTVGLGTPISPNLYKGVKV